MTENEQKYFDEVVGVLKAKGNIGFMDRPRLARLGTSLGVSVERALELDGEAKKFLKQEGARLAEEERLRKEREAAVAEERRKAEEARVRAEREAAEAEERRRKNEKKRKKAETAARKKQEEEERMSPCSADAGTDSSLTADNKTSSPVKADGNGKNAESLAATGCGCVITCVVLVGAIIAFWTGHWIMGIVSTVVALLLFAGTALAAQ